LGFPGGAGGKEPACQRRHETLVQSWDWEDRLSQEEEEMLEEIKKEYPEYTQDAKEMMKAGEDLKQLLSVLNSFY
jgi:hypothetical protein